MSRLGRTLVSLLNHHVPLRIPCRYRRGAVRTITETFENEAEYKEHREKQKVKIIAKKKAEKQAKTKKDEEISSPPSSSQDAEFDFYSEIPRDILNLKYTKPNPAAIGNFSKLMLNMKSRAYRERHGTCLLEGKYLISDAMEAGLFIRLLYFSRLQNLVDLPIDILKKTSLVKVEYEEIKLASEVKVQSEGVLAIATKQDEITRKKLITQRQNVLKSTHQSLLRVTLICDNIRDAGNMGTILRSAAAAGCEQVITTKGCVDIWEPKVIRAGVGAHFKIPIIPSLDWGDIQSQLGQRTIGDVFLCSPKEGDIKISDVIPALEGRRKLYEELVSNLEDEDGDAAKDMKDVVFCSLPYYDIPFINEGHTVIILGGEVHGLSADAYLYALDKSKRDSSKPNRLYNLVNIPMLDGVDCVNTAVAGGIILFEVRKQMLEDL